MNKKTVWIIVTVVGVAALLSGLGVLIWWLVTREQVTTIVLASEGFNEVQHTAALARKDNDGDIFWWFFPTKRRDPSEQPLVLWLDGLAGLPPSLLANFAMFGPFDLNLNRRVDSWVEEYNLLFIDAPIGTGFSTYSDGVETLRKGSKGSGSGSTGGSGKGGGGFFRPRSYRRRTSGRSTRDDENRDDVVMALQSFYNTHGEYRNAPLYIFAQGDGAHLALPLAFSLSNNEVSYQHNLKGIILGNPIVSPALTLTKLGFYLDEMGYIDPRGRIIVEEYTNEINSLVDSEEFEEAFDKFIVLGEFINEQAGAIAVNMGHLLQKLPQGFAPDFFGHREYLRSALQLDLDFNNFMTQTAAPMLGLDVAYDAQREFILQELKGVYMKPITDQVENILDNTDLTVTIYNGNLDAISATPGQLEWVNSLQWSGQEEFRAASRQTLVVNGLVQGYFRETDKLTFYWINAAGVSVPLDSPDAMRRVLERVTGN